MRGVSRLNVDPAIGTASARGHPGNSYAESQNRTGDTRFFRPVLYRLSYLGTLNHGLFSDFGAAIPAKETTIGIRRTATVPDGRPPPIPPAEYIPLGNCLDRRHARILLERVS